MLDRGAKARPETAPGNYLIVICPAVVVRPDGRACSEIALSLHAGGDKERIIVMLLVRREDKVVQHLAAGDGAVVPEHGINQAGAIFKIAVASYDELHGSAAVEYPAAIAHDAVDEDDVLADLHRFLFARVDCDVLQLARALDIAIRADLGVLDDLGGLDHAAFSHCSVVSAMAVYHMLSHVAKLFLQQGIVTVFGPQVGVGGDHPVKRIYTPAACLIHYLKFHTYRRILAVLDDAVAKLGMVCRGHLMNIEQHAPFPDDIVAEIMHIMYGTVVTDVAGMYR